jgi:hypothetical protein
MRPWDWRDSRDGAGPATTTQASPSVSKSTQRTVTAPGPSQGIEEVEHCPGVNEVASNIEGKLALGRGLVALPAATGDKPLGGCVFPEVLLCTLVLL